MANNTVINPAIQRQTSSTGSAATVINNEVVEEYNRQNNITDDSSNQIVEGTVLCEKYRVKNQLEVASGEADLYLCTDGAGQYVAKVYKRKFAIKQEVINALLRIDSPFVAKLYETGAYNGYPVEILPYYEKGSLQGRVFSEDYVIKTIIPNINEGFPDVFCAAFCPFNELLSTIFTLVRSASQNLHSSKPGGLCFPHSGHTLNFVSSINHPSA